MREAAAFAEALLSGMIVCAAYLCIRKFRKLVRHSLKAVGAEDILFWSGTAVYVFVQIYHTSDGSIRFFFLLGVAFGAGLLLLTGKLLGRLRKKIYGRKGRKSEKSIEERQEKD